MFENTDLQGSKMIALVTVELLQLLNENLRHQRNQYHLGYVVYVMWRNEGNSYSLNFADFAQRRFLHIDKLISLFNSLHLVFKVTLWFSDLIFIVPLLGFSLLKFFGSYGSCNETVVW